MVPPNESTNESTNESPNESRDESGPESSSKPESSRKKGDRRRPVFSLANVRLAFSRFSSSIKNFIILSIKFLSEGGRPFDRSIYTDAEVHKPGVPDAEETESDDEEETAAGEKKTSRFWRDIPLLVSSLFSQDPSVRRAAVFLVLSFLATATTLSVIVHRALHKIHVADTRKRARLARKIQSDLEKARQEEERMVSLLTLGTFLIEVSPPPGEVKAKGEFGLAEVEIVVKCDSKETRDFLFKNLPQVRGHLSVFITGIDRDEFLSREGKRRFRDQIKNEINRWLPEGKVREIFTPKLILS